MINITKKLNVVIQGITGKQGSFHTREMLAAGTHIVAGTSPHKAGETIHGVPVFASLYDAGKVAHLDVSVIFVPPAFAKSAMMEAVTSGIKLIVCITEGIPTHDFLAVKKAAEESGAIIVGPNCPGILAFDESGHIANKLGIIPANIAQAGCTAVVSRSGTLTYEVTNALKNARVGTRYVVGIGGDPVKGSSFVDWLRVFENDPLVKETILIGEIGGHDEQIAADFIGREMIKPVFAYVAGHHAPTGKQLGHAGAIIGGNDETATTKTVALAKSGAITAASLDQLVYQIVAHKNTYR